MKIALAQVNPIIGDLHYNKKKILSFLEEAKEARAEMVVFPELALCGYPPEDLLLAPSFVATFEKELLALAPYTKGIVAIIGGVRINPSGIEKPFFNTAALFEDGKWLGYQDKCLLPTYDVFDERRYFEPGKSSALWKLKGKRVAVTICEDIWQHAKSVEYTHYSVDPIKALQEQQPDLIVNLSASPFYLDRARTRENVVRKVIESLRAPLILCNQVGANDGLIFDGSSLAMNSQAEVIARGQPFKEELVVFNLEDPPLLQEESPLYATLYEALVLGIRDYFSKQGFTRACLGLSGGIDSALVLILAQEALGPENILALQLPSRFTAKRSLQDGNALAAQLAITTREISIEKPHELFLEILAPHFENRPYDVTEENLQARIRATILMAFSNKMGYLLLSTANKSELAMGYSTLYGDMCGALSVIGDLTKEHIYGLSGWIQQAKGIDLHSIITREPTAELKENQKDSDTLPPYPQVDLVIREYVEEGRSSQEISTTHQLPLHLVEELIARLHRNEYKRRQSALTLRVTKKAFMVGRRLPIVHHWCGQGADQ